MSYTLLNETNTYFNLVYTLTQQQLNDTINLYPSGFYYLRDTTDSLNLGNNTVDQTKFSLINVYITNGNQLLFNNRFFPSTGTKILEINFNNGPPNFNINFSIQSLTYNASILSQPYYAQNNVNNSQIFLTETTSKFDAIYTLTQQQMNDTIVANPGGFYYLRDETDSITLGINTIDQTKFTLLNVYITNGNQLVFNNRFFPSIGIKNVDIKFNIGPPNFFDFFVPETTLIYNAKILKNKTPCFKEDSKILTDKGYKLIQDLRKGDLIKTLKNGYLPIDMIGKREIYHLASNERIKDQLYKCSQDHFEEIFEPLIITGCHSILVDNFISEEQRNQTIGINGNIYITNNKYRLPVCVDERASVYEIAGNYTIYHLALENDDYYMNYGIYANGLLVETCSKRYLKELSNMTLIE
jgi:hypothetical protein